MTNRLFKIFLFILFLFLTFFILKVNANIDQEIDELTKQINNLKENLVKKEKNYQQLNNQLFQIKQKIEVIEKNIFEKEKEIKKSEKVLDYQKNLLNERAKSYYKNISKSSFSLINILISSNFSQSLADFFYQKTVLDEDRKTIIKIVLYIKNLEETKKKLEQEKNQLTFLKQEINKQSQILSQEIDETKQKIAELSAKQQELIAKKFAENPISRSAGTSLGGCSPDYDPLNDQIKKDSGFSPKFGFFSIGVPNKIGMNQYGAYGRAKKGQDYRQILNAYYNNIRFECRNFPNNNIKVQGYGEINIKDYLKGLGEMPLSWGESGGYEAFKAQVVSASSYAYSYTNKGEREICITEKCQVYIGSKKGGRWDQAVDEVNSECGDGVLVMVSNETNEVITAWYSSTHGGVILRSDEIGWSGAVWTKHGFDADASINNLRDLLINSYDGPNNANSPWFYCNWGYRAEYNNTAWLKEDEVLEIVNALILFKLDNSTLIHLSQLDKNISDTWDEGRVRQEIKNRGGQYFSSISSIEVLWDGSGISRTIIIRGDIGERQYNAQEFKDIFNLRARGNLVILPACLITKSSEVGRCKNYALFDVVKK